MKAWSVQDAQARFSKLLDACVSQGPQLVTRRGAETAVLVSVAEWQRLRGAARTSLKELLLSASARSNLRLPVRDRAIRRALPAL